MKRPFAAVSAALLALTLSASVGVAQGPPQGGGPNRRIQALMNGITLTAAQQTKVDSITGAFRAQMPAFTPGAPPDSAARARRMDLLRQQDDAIRAVLTPEQQTVFDHNRTELQNMPRRPGGGDR